ncbi:cell division protein DedD [Acerihabitans arboris]|uniref:Cell division protein DedD n=1 Tax=Acerihabitans arboris TaxID=2691583 RepID=A0A845SR14_9GAMM|nr:cell division protein DedD [Acerihabitans arboris]NDL65316.1 cell division protein DedD [Acerihabitans arboris]
MASKFQNRLVGTIIIVALGVIVLPGLLDGKKKHYQDEFAAIPLVPKPGDSDEADASPQANQALPSQPPEGAGAAVEQASQAPDADGSDTPDAPEPAAATPVKPTAPAPRHEPPKAAPAKPAAVARQEPVKPAARPEQAKPAPAPRVEPAKPAARPETKTEVKPVTPRPEAAPETKPVTAPAAKPTAPAAEKETPEQAPQGQAWVVQLGALKNAAKVTEIVGKLRLSGYRVYTVPSVPVAGQITRIFVGPDASKQKLQSSLPEMNQLSGLSGQLRAYQTR